MKRTLTLGVAVALLLQLGAAPATTGQAKAGATPPAAAKGAEVAALEKKLLGAWRGGACAVDYTFNADGTYECRNFTPGQNTLTGTWSVRWDALPPKLVLLCKTSDFKKKAPQWPEYEYLGKPLELRLVELNGERWGYQYAKDNFVWRNERAKADAEGDE